MVHIESLYMEAVERMEAIQVAPRHCQKRGSTRSVMLLCRMGERGDWPSDSAGVGVQELPNALLPDVPYDALSLTETFYKHIQVEVTVLCSTLCPHCEPKRSAWHWHSKGLRL